MRAQQAEAGPEAGPASDVPADLPDGVELWLVRHGETDWSRSGRHTGRTDLPLTPAGEDEARGLRAVLGDVRPALVLCSPLLRARDTARLAGYEDIVIDNDLAE